MKTKLVLGILLLVAVGISAKETPEVITKETYGVSNAGTTLVIKFEKGKEHNHPLFAIWLADEDGKYIQTLYVAESIGHGIFLRADRNTGSWQAGPILRPAALPYWAHQRAVLNEHGGYMPTPRDRSLDAYCGATPQSSFELTVKTEKPLEGKYKIMMEINQSWDWNEYWYNDKFPDDKEYKTSSQPALVYSADIHTNSMCGEIELTPIGHGHYSGANGSLTTDLSTLTTALKIAKRISVRAQKY